MTSHRVVDVVGLREEFRVRGKYDDLFEELRKLPKGKALETEYNKIEVSRIRSSVHCRGFCLKAYLYGGKRYLWLEDNHAE